MGIETFEKSKLERVPLSDIAHTAEVAPLPWRECASDGDAAESADAPLEGKVEPVLRLEAFKGLGQERLEVLHDSEMTEQIADYLGGIEKLRYENWQKLSLDERKQLLNTIERQIAQIEHRPPLPIEVEPMKASTFGYQSSYHHKIALNSMYVGSDRMSDYREVIDTIIHEGRHAYQHYNVDCRLVHESASVVNTWKENFYDPKYQYYSGERCIIPIRGRLQDVGFRLYYYQPVEVDARNFAADVMLKLRQRGFLK